jgi:[ribosomal protein S5]-alanine N-acetyltransferase
MATNLETRSLRLVPHAPEHLRALVQGPEEYQRLSGLAPANGLRDFIVSDDVSPEWLAALESATGTDPWRFGFALVHKENGMVIGNAGFTGPPDAEGMVEIAYGVVPDFQGRGYATEAAGALVAWAAKNGRVAIARAHTLPDRNASTRVLEKCGFRFVEEFTHPTDGVIWRWEKQLPVSRPTS